MTNSNIELLFIQVVKTKLQSFAIQAMDRAEEIKNSQREAHQSHQDSISLQHQDTISLQLPFVQPADYASSLAISGGTTSYSKEEKRVLELSSHINHHIFVPFMSIDLKEKFLYSIPFTDSDGKLALAPKQKADFGAWSRISELSDDPKMVANQTIDYFSIKQTVVSDCSFVASLAVAALYEKRFGKALITSILYPKNAAGKPLFNPSGKYSIKLHINGIQRKVIVDDYLPTGRHGQLLCSYSNNRHEFWVSILEKAYMKVMGGYDFPGSNSV